MALLDGKVAVSPVPGPAWPQLRRLLSQQGARVVVNDFAGRPHNPRSRKIRDRKDGRSPAVADVGRSAGIAI